MSAHWFRVGYMESALRRCAAEWGIALEGLTVRSLATLVERFERGYRAQHVLPEDDVTDWVYTTDAAQRAFAVTATRTVRRHDSGRVDQVEVQLLLHATSARSALGTRRLAPGTPVRGEQFFRLTADAPVRARFLNARALPQT